MLAFRPLRTAPMNLQSFVESYGYLAVFVGCLFEGETMLVLGAVSAHMGYLDLARVVGIAAIAGFIGDQAWFTIGRRYGPQLHARFPTFAQHARVASARIDAQGTWLVIMMRFAIGMRTAIPLALGAGSMSHLRFVVLNAIGAVIWAVAFGTAGWMFGNVVTRVLDKAWHDLEIVLAIAAVPVLLFLAVRHFKARTRT